MSRFALATLLCISTLSAFAQHCIFLSDSTNELHLLLDGVDTKICHFPKVINSAEALAYDHKSKQLYIAEEGTLYSLDHRSCRLKRLFDGIPFDVDGLAYKSDHLIMAIRVLGSDKSPVPDSLVEVDLMGDIINGPYAIEGENIPPDVDGVSVHPHTGDVYFVANDGGGGLVALYTIDMSSGHFMEVCEISVSDVEGISFTKDGDLYLVRGTEPSTFWVLDPTTGIASNPITLTASDVEGLNCKVDEILNAELLYFVGFNRENGMKLLQWQTTWEPKVMTFGIERMIEGESEFSGISSVESQGLKGKYEFEDFLTSNTRMVQYRLKLVNPDGSYQYSQVQTLTSGVSRQLAIFPNPASDQLNIAGIRDGNSYVCSIMDSFGRTLVELEGINANVNIDVSDLSAGCYFIKLISGDRQTTRSFVIARK